MNKKTSLLTATMAGLFLFFQASISDASEKEVKTITLKDAASIAEAHTPGEVIEIERERKVFEVEIKTAKGKVVELYIDAKTGEVIKTEVESDDRDND